MTEKNYYSNNFLNVLCGPVRVIFLIVIIYWIWKRKVKDLIEEIFYRYEELLKNTHIYITVAVGDSRHMNEQLELGSATKMDSEKRFSYLY